MNPKLDLAALPARHPFEQDLLVRFAHCDAAGMVFYPQFLVISNGLIEDWVGASLGYGYDELLGVRRVGLPTVALEAQFLAPARLGERLRFGLGVLAVGRSSLTFAIGAARGDEPCLRLRQTVVTTSLDHHRPIPVPDDLRAAAQAHLVNPATGSCA